MKQGWRCVLPVKVNMDFSKVKGFKFIFEQGRARASFDYPSEKARLDEEQENVINLYWSQADTYKFEPRKLIRMDTYPVMKNGETPPETKIVSFMMNETVFKEGEIRYE